MNVATAVEDDDNGSTFGILLPGKIAIQNFQLGRENVKLESSNVTNCSQNAFFL
jgi:hypothetical protein